LENKQQKFERLAEHRMNDTLKKMKLIGNLANKKNYDYTDDHVKAIISTLEKELKVLKSTFEMEQEKEKKTFTFKKNK